MSQPSFTVASQIQQWATGEGEGQHSASSAGWPQEEAPSQQIPSRPYSGWQQAHDQQPEGGANYGAGAGMFF